MQKTLLTLALLGTMGTAQAAHFEIGAGYAKGKLVANGTWRQVGNPYTMHSNNITWFAGITGHPYKYLAYHVDFVHIGTYSENSWDTSDYSYGIQHCLGANCSGGWYNFVGAGMDQGIRVTVGPTFGVGHWHGSLQVGPYFYDSTWHVTIYNTQGQIVGTGDKFNRIQVGDVVGASLRYRGISLAADYYLMRAPQDRNPPLIYGAYVATIGYRF